MKNRSPKAPSLKQKLAVTLSVVNALNVCAPIVLPYVNVARNVRTDGGQAEPLRDARTVIYNTARSLYGTAQASSYNVPNGTATSVSVMEMSNGETMTVSNGGIGTVSTMSGGEQIVSIGGSGTVSTMCSGTQNVSNGGVGIVSTMSGGTQTVRGGASGTVSTMSGGVQDVFMNGSGLVTTMNGGTQIVRNGGVGTVSSLISGGIQILYSGGASIHTHVNSGGILEEKGTGAINSVFFDSGGTHRLVSGAKRYNLTVSGYILEVGNGGTAINATVNNGGTANVLDHGVTSGTTVQSGGKENVSSGGNVAKTTVNDGGVQHVEAGGTATDIIVAVGGTQTINAGGVVSGGTLTGTQTVKGTATSVAIADGGNQTVKNGGTAKDTVVNSGGTQIASAGATLSGTTVSGGVLEERGNANVSDVTFTSGGTHRIASGGTGNNLTVSGHILEAGNGGVLSNTVVQNVGTEQVTSGGTAKGTIVSTGGTQSVTNNGIALNTTIKAGGEQHADAKGILAGTQTVETEGIVSGGTLKEITIGGTAIKAVQNVSGQVQGVTVASGATQNVESGGVVNSGTISGGTQVVNNGTVNDATLKSGSQVVNGGTVTSTTISGGTQTISGGSVSGTKIDGGTQIVRGGSINDTTLNNGKQVISGGNITSNNINGGEQEIHSGTVSGTTIRRGAQTIGDGCKAEDVTIEDSGTQTIVSGGTALKGIVNSGGTQVVGNLGVASTTAINSSGAQLVSAGGRASFTTISSGGTQILQTGNQNQPGGVSEHITMEGGTLIVGDYARAQFDEAEGGVLRLLDLGLAEAVFGSLDVPSFITNFEVTTLYARGDTVRLGLGDGSKSSTVNKTLKIGTMDGYAYFVVNTDLKNNQSDKIVIGTAKNTTKANTIRINYDPTLAKGEEVLSSNATVAEVGNGKATFEGVKSTINSIDYFPEIETMDGGKTWVIRRVTKAANEATHSTVMGMAAGMAALSTGNDFIGAATEGLSLAASTGADGVSAYATFGGGTMRQETGSHVNMNTWNAILALGYKNKKESKAEERNESQSDSLRITNSKSLRSQEFVIGAYFEYGSGSYTTHDGDYRGDGSVRNTGGGLLAKWTAAHGLYVEGSLRAGTLHDDASSVLHDNAGNAYGYDTNAGYWGAHIGVGKEIPLANGDTLDVYGRFFYNRRNGVSFTANKSDFDLDAVTSQVLRVGARYMMKREKWNFYGGLAYEYELGGKATGTVQGLEIRGADVKGGSARLELGATMKPDKNSPWSLDLNAAGFAGKKQGLSGDIAVSFMF